MKVLEKIEKIETGLEQHNRENVGDILNKLLADEFILYTKTRNYHWNVVGMQFNDLHKFFEAQYEALQEIVDDVAERLRAIGLKAAGSVTEYLQLTRLKEHPGDYPDAKTMLENLLKDHEMVIRNLRANAEECGTRYKDAGTEDFLVGLMEQHEKMAWMLRAFVS